MVVALRRTMVSEPMYTCGQFPAKVPPKLLSSMDLRWGEAQEVGRLREGQLYVASRCRKSVVAALH